MQYKQVISGTQEIKFTGKKMKMKSICISCMIMIFSVSVLSGDQYRLPEVFSRKLQANSLVFKMPADFAPVKIDPEKTLIVNYFYALKHKKKKLEIRYTTYPFEKPSDEPDRKRAGSDKIYKILSYTVAANIAVEEGNILQSVILDSDAVKADFGADWGSTSLLKPGSKFGEGYQRVMVIFLYKSGSGYACISYLFDDSDDIKSEIGGAFYSLRFKE